MSAAYEWSMWSTRMRVRVTDARLLDAAVARTRALLEEIDAAASRFRVDSEISTLASRMRPDRTVHLSPLLASLIRVALETAEQTGGAVDPTVGRTMVDLGYDRSFPQIVATGFLPAAVHVPVGWRSVELDGDVLRVPAEVRLDLGASAKSVAADRAASLVHATLGCGVLVCLGGDIATAGSGPTGGWQVRVRDHHDDPDDTVTLADGWAVATSSTARRTWHRDGQLVHHIVDPASGRPAPTTWRTVTVVAPTCAQANAASTATIVKGAGGFTWLGGRGLAARLVDERGHVHRLGGWPRERDAA